MCNDIQEKLHVNAAFIFERYISQVFWKNEQNCQTRQNK